MWWNEHVIPGQCGQICFHFFKIYWKVSLPVQVAPFLNQDNNIDTSTSVPT